MARDPICVDGGIVTLVEWLKGFDSRIRDRSLDSMTSSAAIFILVSGAGKSPLIMKSFLKMALEMVEELKTLDPGGLNGVVTAGCS